MCQTFYFHFTIGAIIIFLKCESVYSQRLKVCVTIACTETTIPIVLISRVDQFAEKTIRYLTLGKPVAYLLHLRESPLALLMA